MDKNEADGHFRDGCYKISRSVFRLIRNGKHTKFWWYKENSSLF